MILDSVISEKSIGNKILIQDSHFTLEKNEKVGLIGANGAGKSTLLNILCGNDDNYDGSLHIQNGVPVLWARQEHTKFSATEVIEYILQDLPEYTQLHHIIESFASIDNPTNHQLEKYSDALERFTQLGYFEIENSLEASFDTYQLKREHLRQPMGTLSGGQKRLVELIKLQQAKGAVLVLDEPTNHMDYIAKATFIDWLKSVKSSVILVSHDRDVLAHVDRVIELRDQKLHNYRGNYQDYLRTHTARITGSVHEYEVTQKRISNLKEDVIRYQRLKEKARNPGTIKRFKSLEERTRKELDELQKLEKPTFWIDKDASSHLKSSVVDVYNKHKAKTITIHTNSEKAVTNQTLIDVDNLSLGYDAPLFSGLSFRLSKGQRLHVVGRNGAGKTTLFNAIIHTALHTIPSAKIFTGQITIHNEVRLGVYEQEVPTEMLHKNLGEAVEEVLRTSGRAVSEQAVKSELNKYLFNAHEDYDMRVENLSGGQKARLQLIRMLVNKPNVLLLDEPTNHLDLPSIEELETALTNFTGAILYISHDSYFTRAIKGDSIEVGVIK